MDIQKKNVLGRGNGKCKGPEAEVLPAFLNNSEAGSRWWKEWEMRWTGPELGQVT